MTFQFARRALRALLVLALLVLLVGAWVGLRVYQVQRDLRAAVDDASALQAAVTARDPAGSEAALARLREHGDAAAAHSGGPTWAILTHLPVVGDDAKGVQTVSGVVSDLGRDALPPLTRSADRLDGLTPVAGKIDLQRLAALKQPVSTGAQAFADADGRLAGGDPDGYFRALRTRYVDLAHRVHTVARQLSAARTALDIMPTMLGARGPKNYLLVVENNAEVRATGGLPGSVSLLRADAGKVSLVKQVPGNQLTAPPGKELAVTSEEQPIYSKLLGQYFLDANFTPDFPRAAELMKQLWQLRHRDRIDGVVTLDPVTLSYLLAALGPVTVDGVTLTADNAVDELLHGVYLRLSNPQDQDQFFQGVARAVFGLVTKGAPSPEGLLRAFSRGVSEHRILVHSFDHTVQASIAEREIAGAVRTDLVTGPQMGFYVNDTTGAKMSYYLRYAAKVVSTSCAGGRQQLKASAALESQAPPDVAKQPAYVTGGGIYGIDPGSQLDTVLAFGPVGGTISGFTIDGKPSKVTVFPQQGRPVGVLVIQLDPGQHATLGWTMRSGPGQTGTGRLLVTPGVAPDNLSSTVPSAC